MYYMYFVELLVDDPEITFLFLANMVEKRIFFCLFEYIFIVQTKKKISEVHFYLRINSNSLIAHRYSNSD